MAERLVGEASGLKSSQRKMTERSHISMNGSSVWIEIRQGVVALVGEALPAAW
jgi:hypothetical protein